MKKITKILGILNLFLIAFLILIFVVVLVKVNQYGTGWNLLVLFSVSLFSLLAAIVLSIPLIFFLLKNRFSTIRFYFFTHTMLLLLSVLLILYSKLSV